MLKRIIYLYYESIFVIISQRGKKMIGIYKISCTEEDTVYIGSSNNIKRRWGEHKRTLKAGTHRNTKLQLAWNAYGSENFTFEIVEETKDIIGREQYHLDYYWPNCYNISAKAWNPMANPTSVLKQIESLRNSGKRGGQKLTEEQVIEIKEHLRELSLTVKELANIYKVSVSQIRMIRQGHRWGHVKVKGFTENTISKIVYDEKDIINMYIEGASIKGIRNKHAISSPSTIYMILRRNSIKTRKAKKAVKLNS